MIKHFDFCVNDKQGWYRDIIRQYPKTTHVHGFGDKIPKEWKQVYKTYYSWRILRQRYDKKGNIIPERTEILLSMTWDEASVFPNLAKSIEYIVETGEDALLRPLGQPGGEWKISKNIFRRECYDFEVFDNYYNTGYRFTLTPEQLTDFCKWLDMVNDYALSRGEPA